MYKSGNLTLKNAAVLPPLSAPYLIFVCLARSSALSIGESILSTVRKAARLAVYEEIMMSVKNHHMPATMRVDTALRYKSLRAADNYPARDALNTENATFTNMHDEFRPASLERWDVLKI